MPRPVDTYLGLGSNLGNRRANLVYARRQLALGIGRVTAGSHLYESEAWGDFAGETFPYLNTCVCVRTRLKPAELIQRILAIEQTLGRVRDAENQPRTIDIDVLLYGQELIHRPDLAVPHPRMLARRFVLVPLNEIAPELIHPGRGRSIRELLASCPDPLAVRRA